MAGKKNLLVVLRDARVGELAVMDAKTLVESRTIKLTWCESGEAVEEKVEKDPS
jgi:hypothetical protein